MTTPRPPSRNISKLLNHLRTIGALELMTQLQHDIDEMEAERQSLCNALGNLATADRSSWVYSKGKALQILKIQGWSCPTT